MTPDDIVDLTNCDREPIHIIGAIQPIGFLLALTADWIVARASANLADHLGIAADEVIGVPLADLFAPRAVHDLRNRTAMLRGPDAVERLFDALLIETRGRFDVAVHFSQGQIVIEGEPAAGERGDAGGMVRSMISRLDQCGDMAAFFREGARQVRALVGFDRVMVYRFSGDGSVIDAAKGVALLVGNGGDILDYEGVDRMGSPIPPMVMVPATSGTGADVSQFCIVTDTRRNTKITILGRTLVPDVSVVDPRLLVTMPDWLNAATGLDALTHGVEAFVSRAHNPLTDHHALQAISLVGAHLVDTMDHPQHEESRLYMAQAALEAGLAFTNAILGAAHAMSHQVGGLLDLPHGVINGVLLPHVIRFNAAADPGRFVPIAQALGLPGAVAPDSEAGAAEAAEWAAAEVRRLADELGVPRGLAEIGVTEADVPKLAAMTMADACLSTNPREADIADVDALFRTAL